VACTGTLKSNQINPELIYRLISFGPTLGPWESSLPAAPGLHWQVQAISARMTNATGIVSVYTLRAACLVRSSKHPNIRTYPNLRVLRILHDQSAGTPYAAAPRRRPRSSQTPAARYAPRAWFPFPAGNSDVHLPVRRLSFPFRNVWGACVRV
jgi:hypothetical protein